MRIKNFESWKCYALAPEEEKNYLKTFFSFNPRVKLPQFHTTFHARPEYNKEQLADLAENGHQMGYGGKPNIVVFHSDTETTMFISFPPDW